MMRETLSRRVRTVTSPEAVRFLLNPDEVRFLEPFMHGEVTIRNAAAFLGCKPNSLLVKTKKMKTCGLVEIVREIPRSGRAIKMYRSTAEEYFIPSQEARVVDQDLWERDRTKLLHEGLNYTESQLTKSVGRRIHLDEYGVLTNSAATDQKHDFDLLSFIEPALLSSSHDRIYLDFEDAKALQENLEKLLQGAMKKQGAQRYLIWLNLVPLPEQL